VEEARGQTNDANDAETAWLSAHSESDAATKERISRILSEARAIAYDLGDASRKIDYDHRACQYDEKIGDVCALCVTSCTEKAIVKDETAHRLQFDFAACTACGKCVGICPTGALELGAFGARAFEETAKLYEALVPLVIDEKALKALERALPAGVAPFIVPTTEFLGETALLTLLQESGSQIVLYGEANSEAIALMNEAWLALYGKSAVLPIENIEEAQPIAGSRYALSQSSASARAAFAARLREAVGEGDFGVARSPRFGAVKIDEEKCTLCASCAQNCPTNAISADETEGILRACDALCTNCGECVAICPEKAIAIESGAIALKAESFQPRIAAKDVAFCCAECGKPFAASRSIRKVIAFMTPIFAGDETKIRSLSLCAECKPKAAIKDLMKGLSVARN
jgi:ferredoxin